LLHFDASLRFLHLIKFGFLAPSIAFFVVGTASVEKAGDVPQKDLTVHTDTTAALTESASEKQHEAAPKIVEPKKRIATLIPVVDQADILPTHRVLADNVLRSIDARCRTTLKNFYVRYDHPQERGLGGGGTIIITGNVSDDEFRALLIHECGHVIDTGAMNGTEQAGLSSFVDGKDPVYIDDPSVSFYAISWLNATQRKATSSDNDFVSGYAAWNPFEDFAETFAYYVLQRDAFSVRAHTNAALNAKYVWMQAHISPTIVAAGQSDASRQWDVTKLPYQWKGIVEVAQQ
jgi:hypothetical protein